MGRARLYIEGLSAFRAVDLLAREGVGVLSAQKTQKNGVLVDVKSKEVKKAFAILRASCYNVKKVRFRGSARFMQKFLPRVGLLAGGICFLLFVSLAQTRVLRVDVSGSGSCYESEVREILLRAGLGEFSPYPNDVACLKEEILSLPRVSYCAFSYGGGILTVEVQVSDEGAILTVEPLRSSISGVVGELTVVRGRALVCVGDAVNAGDCLVDCVREDGSSALVVASVSVAFSQPISGQFEGEKDALSFARLTYPTAQALTVTQTEEGWLAEGTVRISMNML